MTLYDYKTSLCKGTAIDANEGYYLKSTEEGSGEDGVCCHTEPKKLVERSSYWKLPWLKLKGSDRKGRALFLRVFR
ncbi:hypothetical protein TNCV_2990621 [Trichonephila clavipes]|nr:hypothetical protein TNCV_2990621 [Trichonephila clavipes]